MTNSAVLLQNVVKRFGDMVAVDGINLEIDEGDFVAFIGPSGCGKTTTLRIMAGLEEPSAGQVFIRGKQMNDVKPWERDTPMVWQNFALFPFLSVAKNVEFALRMKGVEKAKRGPRVQHWLDMVGIGNLAQRSIGQLSGGQKQRVALARALVTEPSLLLLDEPLGSLDAHLRVHMQGELRRLQQELGITFIYVTHNQSEALAMANRVIIMDEGRIQQIGPPQDVYRAPLNRFVAEFVGTNNILSGEVDDVHDGVISVRTPLGQVKARPGKGPTPTQGQPITLVISADRIDVITGDQPPGRNTVTGRLIGEEFVGAVVTLFLELPDGTEFRVQKQQHEIERIQLRHGEQATIAWAPESTYILPES